MPQRREHLDRTESKNLIQAGSQASSKHQTTGTGCESCSLVNSDLRWVSFGTGWYGLKIDSRWLTKTNRIEEFLAHTLPAQCFVKPERHAEAKRAVESYHLGPGRWRSWPLSFNTSIGYFEGHAGNGHAVGRKSCDPLNLLKFTFDCNTGVLSGALPAKH